MKFTSRSRSLASLCLGLAVTLAVTACSTVPLVEPPKISAAATPEITRSAIIRALIRYTWVVDEESPGRVRARLQRGGWTMIVDVLYDKTISVNYVDSVALDYKVEGDIPYIHKGYNARADTLLKEIQRQVMIAGLENRPMPSVSSPPAATPPPAPAPKSP